VRRAGQQGAQDEHIERALQEFGAVLRLFFHDSRESTTISLCIVDAQLWERFRGILGNLEAGGSQTSPYEDRKIASFS
jgi:hypothetical protein